MVAPASVHGNTQPQDQSAVQRSTIPSLKTLQTDPAVQEDLKALEDSLGDPILLGLSDELADPAQQLLEPRSSLRGKRPLLIPDFVSSLPVVLEEDRETVLGVSGGTQIILKTNNQKKPQLANISFPQWSAAYFRIMHTLIKEGDLSSTSVVTNYISYSTKVSELAKIYPIPRVVQYDNLYHRMQFASSCKWSTESQFIYQQSLQNPDATQPGSTSTIHFLASQVTHYVLMQHYRMPSSLFQPHCLALPLAYQHPQAVAWYLSHMQSSTTFLNQWH